MMWVPQTTRDPDDRPIVLISDRRRLWLAGIPMLLVFALAVAVAILRGPGWLLIALVLVEFLIAWLARGGKAGYYEVRRDGTLGDYLGNRMPAVIRDMQRAKL
jgi:hypothetical protein